MRNMCKVLTLAKIEHRTPFMWFKKWLVYLVSLRWMCIKLTDEHIEAHGGPVVATHFARDHHASVMTSEKNDQLLWQRSNTQKIGSYAKLKFTCGTRRYQIHTCKALVTPNVTVCFAHVSSLMRVALCIRISNSRWLGRSAIVKLRKNI